MATPRRENYILFAAHTRERRLRRVSVLGNGVRERSVPGGVCRKRKIKRRNPSDGRPDDKRPGIVMCDLQGSLIL